MIWEIIAGGASYVSGDLAVWLKDKEMKPVRGAFDGARLPQSLACVSLPSANPGKDRTLAPNAEKHSVLAGAPHRLRLLILLENHFFPGDLEVQIEAFVDHYNHQRYHESLGNVTPADAYFGRDKTIIAERQRIKQMTIENRRPSAKLRRALQHRMLAA